MKIWKSIIFCCLAIALASVPALAKDVPGYAVAGNFDAAAVEAQQAALSEWLAGQQADKALDSSITIQVTEDDWVVAEEEGGWTRTTSKMLVGVNRPTEVFVDLDRPAIGAVSAAKSRVTIWSGVVHSDGASALKIHFTDFALPEGAEVYVYNHSGEAFGPYANSGPRNEGQFWTKTITGDTLWIQARVPAGASGGFFTISEVGHLGSNFVYGQFRNRNHAKAFCSYNADCVNKNSGTDTSVALYQFVSGAYWYICSGGLIADESQSGTPYFLTANHCVSKGREASTVETFFFYTGDCNGPSAMQGSGASIAASNRTGDYTILLLDDPAPAGSSFLGWTTTAVQDGDTLNRVSHPSGAPQAYSTHVVDSGFVECQSWGEDNWIYSKDLNGATEGGSSGSPVRNSQGKIVGQLSGGCGYNINDVCDADNNRTVDGEFAAYYGDVASILGGSSGCSDDLDSDTFISESCGGADCNDSDASINPLATELCDGIDNNCDGNIDEGCGSCLPKGDACSSGSECCSGRCHPKKNTCQ